jgi:DNA-binding CsgD family transcriptional regulator
MLEEAGLSPAESAVLIALVGRPHASSADLADVVDEPGPVLRSLCARGLAVHLNDDGDTYRAADPTLLLQSAVTAAEERVDRLRQLATDLLNRHRTAQSDQLPIDFVEYLPGGDAAVIRLYELIRSAQRWVCGLELGPWLTGYRPGGYSPAGAEFEAIGRGVEFRVIYERAAIDEPGRLEDILWSVDRGEQARVLPSLPCVFYLIDDLAAIPVTDSGRIRDGALITRGGPLLVALKGWYEALWASAIPLGVLMADPDGTDFSAKEQELIGLLASGLTDKAIARQLGVSERTAQRRVAAILQRLGAHTRFQAGIQAARRGLF